MYSEHLEQQHEQAVLKAEQDGFPRATTSNPSSADGALGLSAGGGDGGGANRPLGR